MITETHLSRRTALRYALFSGGGALLYHLGVPFTTPDDAELIEREIPSTGEALPAIGMGTWQTFDVGDSEQLRTQRKEVLRIFAERGGRVIDSSPMYGSSERVVGDLAAELGLLDQLFMATKVWTRGRQAGIQQMEASMNKMRSDPMDLMQVHNLVDLETHLQTLRRWKSEGKVRYIGATHYQVSRHDDMAALIEREKPDFIQINFSIQTRNAQEKLLPLARKNGVAVIINRPFEGGALFNKIRGRELPGWAADYDIRHWSQFFLKYIIAHPAVTCAIPATTNPDHMRENMGAAYGRLPDMETRERMVAYWGQ